MTITEKIADRVVERYPMAYKGRLTNFVKSVFASTFGNLPYKNDYTLFKMVKIQSSKGTKNALIDLILSEYHDLKLEEQAGEENQLILYPEPKQMNLFNFNDDDRNHQVIQPNR